METTSNVSKCKKDVLQSDSTITGKAGTLPFALSNTDRNAYWGTEPNFNLNLNLMSPSNPRSLLEATKQHGGIRKDGNKESGKSGVKGAAETSKVTDICATSVLSSGEKEDPPQQRSRIPGLFHSPIVKTRDKQRLKSLNPKHTSTLSPKMLSHKMMAVPKPQQSDQTTIESCSKTTEQIKIRTQKTESTINCSVIPRIVLKTESASETSTEIAEGSLESLKVQTDNEDNSGNVIDKSLSQQILHHSRSSKVHRGDANMKISHQANRATITNPKICKADPESTARKSNEQTSHEPRTPLSELMKSSKYSKLHCQSEMAFLNTKTTQQGSFSPNPSTQKKATTPRDTNTTASGSKDSLDSKEISSGSQSKNSSKCSSNLKRGMSKNSLLSKASSEWKTSLTPKAEMGSQDTLELKSQSASKTRWGSKDNLDSKSRSNPNPSTCSKSGTGSRDNIDSKIVSEVEGNSASKTSLDYKTVVVFKSHIESKDDLHSKTQITLASKCSSGPNTILCCNTGSEDSLVVSGSKNSNLKASGSNTKSYPDSNATSHPSNAGPVQSSSTSLSADSPRTGSPTRGVGNREHQRTPCSAPGSGAISGSLTPLATSSPKTTIVASVMGESTMKPTTSVTNGTKPSHSPKNPNLKPYDSITEMPEKTMVDNEKDNIKVTECKIPALQGPVASQGAVRGVDMTDSTGIQPSKPSHLGDANTIAAGGNIHSSETTKVETEYGNKKQQDRVKQRNNLGSAPLSPSLCSHSANAVNRTTVSEAATMTDFSVRQKEVGVQVEAEMIECSASTSPNLSKGALTSSLIDPPSGQSSSLISAMVPSLCCIPAGQPPSFQHICKIEIELHSQSVLPSVLGDKASSLPACLRTYSFQKSPALMPKLSLGLNKDRNMSAKSVLKDEEEKDKGTNKEGVEDKNKVDEMVKPQNVVWDEQGMTWEVYGASVDLESLGTAIQSHLESKIREQEKHIRTLRKSICSDPRAWKMQKRKKRRGGILGCCRKASALAD